MKEYYYLNHRNVPQGAYSLAELAEMMAQGRVNPTTLVACKGAESWEPLGSILSQEQLNLPELKLRPGQVGNCPSCGYDLNSETAVSGQLPPSCPNCGRALSINRKGLSIWQNFRLSIRNYAFFSGRATRAEYWSFVLMNALILLLLYAGFAVGLVSIIGVEAMEKPSTEEEMAQMLLRAMEGEHAQALSLLFLSFCACYLIWMLYSLIPWLSLTVRRLHDAGWSGWWLLPQILLSLAVASMDMILTPDLILVQGYLELALFASSVFIFVLMLRDSERGANAYGPSRKYPLG